MGMNLLPPRLRLRMSLVRQLRMLWSRDPFADLTEAEWKLVQADIEARLRWVGNLEQLFEIVRRAARDIREALREGAAA